ncbi:MAG: helicase-related protein [Balneolaceae bacterium]
MKKMLKALPKKRQTLFFSATMPQEIVQLSNSILTNPTKIEVTPESATVDKIRQGIFHVNKGNKKQLLVDVLTDENVGSALVFTRTKRGANNVVKMLNKKSIQAEAIHGNKSQSARQRALSNFKDQSTRVLVATDIAARGIDVDELQYVINYEIPNIPETYVHRIGRTGRAGSDGTALSFVDSSEKEYLRDIEKLINQKIPVMDERGNGNGAVPDTNTRQAAPAQHNGSSHGNGNGTHNRSNGGKRPRPKSSGRRGSRR